MKPGVFVFQYEAFCHSDTRCYALVTKDFTVIGTTSRFCIQNHKLLKLILVDFLRINLR